MKNIKRGLLLVSVLVILLCFNWVGQLVPSQAEETIDASWDIVAEVFTNIIEHYWEEIEPWDLVLETMAEFGEIFALADAVTLFLSPYENYEELETDCDNLIDRIVDYFDQHHPEIDEEEIIQTILKAMVSNLDIYSAFMTRDNYEEMQMRMEGEYAGVGVVITIRENRLTVVSTFRGTPGGNADIKPGDVILFVDGVPTEGVALDVVASRIRGPEGTDVVLTIHRPEEEREFDITLTRAIIQVPIVEHEVLGDNIGLVGISEFAYGVGRKVQSSLNELKAAGVDKVILDLRSNPGGALSEAVYVASLFVPRGPVVHVADRTGVVETLRTSPFYRNIDLPLVVLVNEGSASGSEIVAAAIQEHGTGVLLGAKTFGKGTVQTIIPLSDGSGLRLTTARYYTPNFNFIGETGIAPDYYVDADFEVEEDEQLQAAIRYLLGRELDQAG